MDDDPDIGDLAAGGLHGRDTEAAMHRAVPAPQDHPGPLQLGSTQAAHRLVRVEDDAIVQGAAEVAHIGVASQVLIGQERGPRFGSFAALYGIDNTRKLIAQALAGELS